jgi:hypothetical protein
VRDDVVELPVAVVDVHYIRGDEPDVGQLQRLDHRIALGDLDAREINADQLCPRQFDRHREDIAACGAAQLEDATGLQRRGLEARQVREGPQAVGMRPGNGIALVRDFIVAGLVSWRHRRCVYV